MRTKKTWRQWTPERILESIVADPQTGCWLWTGKISPNGYASVGGKLIHRTSYEFFIGSIAEGLCVDHLCRVRHCVNPDHMEVVTYSENVKRGLLPGLNRSRKNAKTHCPNGHLYTESNSSFNSRGHRECRECHRLRAGLQYRSLKRKAWLKTYLENKQCTVPKKS